MHHHIGEPFSFKRVGGAHTLDFAVGVNKGSADELIINLDHTVHCHVDGSPIGDLVCPSTSHGFAVFYGNQGWNSGLGQLIIHSHVVGATTILDLSRHGHRARYPGLLLVLQFLEDVDGGVPDVTDLHLLYTGFSPGVGEIL